jgi:hypothetical protein
MGGSPEREGTCDTVSCEMASQLSGISWNSKRLQSNRDTVGKAVDTWHKVCVCLDSRFPAVPETWDRAWANQRVSSMKPELRSLKSALQNLHLFPILLGGFFDRFSISSPLR